MTQMRAEVQQPLSREVRAYLEALGQRIKVARVRRGFGTEEFSEQCGIGRRTLFRLESGQAGVAVGVVLSVLWKLGLLETMVGVADPNLDEHGQILEAARRPQRVRTRSVDDNDF